MLEWRLVVPIVIVSIIFYFGSIFDDKVFFEERQCGRCKKKYLRKVGTSPLKIDKIEMCPNCYAEVKKVIANDD